MQERIQHTDYLTVAQTMTFLQKSVTHTTCAIHTISETSEASAISPRPARTTTHYITNIHSKSIFPHGKQF